MGDSRQIRCNAQFVYVGGNGPSQVAGQRNKERACSGSTQLDSEDIQLQPANSQGRHTVHIPVSISQLHWSGSPTQSLWLSIS